MLQPTCMRDILRVHFLSTHGDSIAVLHNSRRSHPATHPDDGGPALDCRVKLLDCRKLLRMSLHLAPQCISQATDGPSVAMAMTGDTAR